MQCKSWTSINRLQRPRPLVPPSRLVRTVSRSSFAFPTSRWRSKSWIKPLPCCRKQQTRQRIRTRKHRHFSALHSFAGTIPNSLLLANPASNLEILKNSNTITNTILLKYLSLKNAQCVLRF